MTRLKALHPEQVSGKTQDLFKAIEGKLGMVPNMMRTMGNSPALLEGYLQLSNALSGGKLGARTGGLLALAIAESNDCQYCRSAHAYIGEKLIHLPTDVLLEARKGNSSDPKVKAALQFAHVLLVKKGLVSDADVQAVKAAGFSEGEVGEIIGHVALNILTNYFNNTANTEIDFPVVEALETATV